MKLLVQIPCLNEADSIARVIADIPKTIKGISVIETVLIDDGSSDDSVQLAREAGISHVLSHGYNKGLADTFRTGIEACLKLNADVIVNFDGDGQYRGDEIEALIAPILSGDADMVIGNRQVHLMESYTGTKRVLHRVGRRVVNWLGGIQISDPVSGFRAFSRDAALVLNIFSSFSYTTETLIQAGNHRLRVVEVPVNTNPTPRPSRLFRSVGEFVFRTAMTVLRTYAMYRPLKVFSLISLLLFAIGAAPVIRFLINYFQDGGAGHVQSLILGATFMVMGCVALMFAILADVQARNRQLLEQMRQQLQRIESELHVRY